MLAPRAASCPALYRPPAAVPLLVVLLGASLIATAPILLRWSDVGPSAFGAYRLGLGGLGLLALAAWQSRRMTRGLLTWRYRLTRNLGYLVLAGVLFAGDLGLWHQSILRTSVMNATFLTNTAPLFVTALAAFWLHEQIQRGVLVCGAIAMVGVSMLVLFGATETTSARSTGQALFGDALGLGSAVFYAGYLLSVKRLRLALPAMLMLGCTSLVGAVLLTAAAMLEAAPSVPSSFLGWVIVLAAAAFGQILGQFLIVWGMRWISVTLSSLALLMQPIVAALLGWVLLGEYFGQLQAIGGALVLGAVWFAGQIEQGIQPRFWRQRLAIPSEGYNPPVQRESSRGG